MLVNEKRIYVCTELVLTVCTRDREGARVMLKIMRIQSTSIMGIKRFIFLRNVFSQCKIVYSHFGSSSFFSFSLLSLILFFDVVVATAVQLFYCCCCRSEASGAYATIPIDSVIMCTHTCGKHIHNMRWVHKQGICKRSVCLFILCARLSSYIRAGHIHVESDLSKCI